MSTVTKQVSALTTEDLRYHLAKLYRPYHPLTRLQLDMLTVPRIVDAVRWHLINTLKQVIVKLED